MIVLAFALFAVLFVAWLAAPTSAPTPVQVEVKPAAAGDRLEMSGAAA